MEECYTNDNTKSRNKDLLSHSREVKVNMTIKENGWTTGKAVDLNKDQLIKELYSQIEIIKAQKNKSFWSFIIGK